jgi:hypothetical protein
LNLKQIKVRVAWSFCGKRSLYRICRLDMRTSLHSCQCSPHGGKNGNPPQLARVRSETDSMRSYSHSGRLLFPKSSQHANRTCWPYAFCDPVGLVPSSQEAHCQECTPKDARAMVINKRSPCARDGSCGFKGTSMDDAKSCVKSRNRCLQP